MKICRTVIVDDEAPARRRMKKLLQMTPCFELIGEAESGAQAIEIINMLAPDLVLLDIQLKDITGFEVIKSITQRHLNVIFITAYDAFAIQAFEENAIDYLLKPYKEERFHEALERASSRLDNAEKRSIADLVERINHLGPSEKIQIPEGNTTHLLDPAKIEYIRSETYYCRFYLENGLSKMIRISLKSLESLLPAGFVRINKSIMINHDKITSIRQLKRTVEIELSNEKKFSFDVEKFQAIRDKIQKI